MDHMKPSVQAVGSSRPSAALLGDETARVRRAVGAFTPATVVSWSRHGRTSAKCCAPRITPHEPLGTVIEKSRLPGDGSTNAINTQQGEETQMRSVRGRLGRSTLVVSVLAVLAAVAVGAPGAAQAETTGAWRLFKNCPYNNPEVVKGEGSPSYCVFGETLGGKEGGQFTVGSVTTPLVKKIILQGGLVFKENPETGQDEGRLVAPTSGKALTAPPLPVPGGVKRITPQIQEEAEWPQELRNALEEAEHHGEGQLYATIELAGGNRVFEERNAVSSQNLINEEGTAVELPLKVKLSSPVLSHLQEGRETCYIGSESHPVVQHLTSGTSGSLEGYPGELGNKESFGIVFL
jgi:hypothetical protein